MGLSGPFSTSRPGKMASDFTTLNEIRLLLLEDSDIEAQLLASHLQKAGLVFRLRRVAGRDAFIAAIAQNSIDVVLAGYASPDFDGLSAVRIAQDLRPDLPFIFVSGVVGDEFADGALRLGAVDYVLKRNISRLPASIERAIAQATERSERRRAESKARELNARLDARIEEYERVVEAARP